MCFFRVETWRQGSHYPVRGQCANQPQSIGVRGTSGRSRALKQTPVPETVAAAVYLLAPYQPTGIVVLPGDTPVTTAKARALSKILQGSSGSRHPHYRLTSPSPRVFPSQAALKPQLSTSLLDYTSCDICGALSPTALRYSFLLPPFSKLQKFPHPFHPHSPVYFSTQQLPTTVQCILPVVIYLILSLSNKKVNFIMRTFVHKRKELTNIYWIQE